MPLLRPGDFGFGGTANVGATGPGTSPFELYQAQQNAIAAGNPIVPRPPIVGPNPLPADFIPRPNIGPAPIAAAPAPAPVIPSVNGPTQPSTQPAGIPFSTAPAPAPVAPFVPSPELLTAITQGFADPNHPDVQAALAAGYSAQTPTTGFRETLQPFFAPIGTTGEPQAGPRAAPAQAFNPASFGAFGQFQTQPLLPQQTFNQGLFQSPQGQSGTGQGTDFSLNRLAAQGSQQSGNQPQAQAQQQSAPPISIYPQAPQAQGPQAQNFPQFGSDHTQGLQSLYGLFPSQGLLGL